MSEVLARIRENAKLYPKRTAYKTAVPTENGYEDIEMTWEDLERKSNQLSFFLEGNLSTKKPVIVYGHKHPLMIAAFLACVKSGRAYVPIDSSFPIGRVQDIINAVEPEQIIMAGHLAEATADAVTGAAILRLDEDTPVFMESESDICDEGKWVSGDEVYYIIFTSGSTGTPKGVQITANCLDNFIKWAVGLGSKKMMADGRHLTFMNQAPFSFDLSVFDLYLSLYTGGTLCSIPKGMQGDMNHLYSYLRASGSDVWVSTPSFADIALADECFNNELLPKMRLFLFCGETLANQTAQKLYERFPEAEVVNTYGPTESTVAVTELVVSGDVMGKYDPLPIGRPKPGTYVFIMDGSGKILPDGEKGEIVIVGNTVSIGYWNNKEKNNEVFGKMEAEGEEYRLYHTRDKGYFKDGLLFYCGRMDLQIKFHGYRIELEDIESNILGVPNIKKAVVMPEYSGGNEIVGLTAYVVSGERFESALKERQRIRNALKKRIPGYMIPKKFIFRDSLPVTGNGKVDRRTLKGD